MSEQQYKRERIAYEELQVGDPIMDGDEWQNNDGRWQLFSVAPIQVLEGSRVRRPYKISTILEIGDALVDAQKAARQLQKERDEARAQGAKLSAELWARKPLEDRVAALTDEVKQLRAERQEYSAKFEAEVTDAPLVADVLTAAKDALKSAQRARDELQLQVDELRADRERLQGLIDNLLDEPTARQVRDMLRTWAIELDWSADCFDSVSREQIDIIQKTLIAVIERIEWLCSENSDDN